MRRTEESVLLVPVMARVARKVDDRRLLKLIRAYLEAGVMVEGVKQVTVEGTPGFTIVADLVEHHAG